MKKKTKSEKNPYVEVWVEAQLFQRPKRNPLLKPINAGPITELRASGPKELI